jgi:hypothetical protein
MITYLSDVEARRNVDWYFSKQSPGNSDFASVSFQDKFIFSGMDIHAMQIVITNCHHRFLARLANTCKLMVYLALLEALYQYE